MKKLTLTPLEGKNAGAVIEALFNPKEYTISKSVPWNPHPTAGLDSPENQFTTGQGESLALELFCDTYEKGESVQPYVMSVHNLGMIDAELHRPAHIFVSWGSLAFRGVVESLTHRYTMFLEDGTPVRATCTVQFREAPTATEQAEKIKKQSPDHAKLHAVRRGETLQTIAAREYDDPAEWRRIADANGIDDPLQLVPGRRLMIPPILR